MRDLATHPWNTLNLFTKGKQRSIAWILLQEHRPTKFIPTRMLDCLEYMNEMGTTMWPQVSRADIVLFGLTPMDKTIHQPPTIQVGESTKDNRIFKRRWNASLGSKHYLDENIHIDKTLEDLQDKATAKSKKAIACKRALKEKHNAKRKWKNSS